MCLLHAYRATRVDESAGAEEGPPLLETVEEETQRALSEAQLKKEIDDARDQND